ncbi:MAG TPA: glycosyltransferase family 4 protein [Caulobacteraceae bacterium]|nr:glycosyltransferase family 4 protein [Caulobacteraceae bacterium]
MRPQGLAIVCADGVEGQGGVERFTQYLTRQFATDAPQLSWFIQKTRFGRGALGHLTTPAALAQFAWRCGTGRVRLAHINVAPRGSTFRKMLFFAVARVFGVRTLLHLHGSGYDGFFERCPGSARNSIRGFFQRADRVAVLGAHWQRFAAGALGVPGQRLLVVQNGVPPPPLQARPCNETAHLVFAGQVGERKGVDVLLTALSKLDAETPNWRATVAGGGDAAPYLRQAREGGIADKVTFAGWLSEPQIGALLATADIFVLPSRAENQPIAILEAMARGLPVVSTTIGAIPEQVEEGVSGLLVPPGEAQPLADALARLIARPAEREVMGAAGHALYQRRFSIEACAGAFLDAYADMLPAAEEAAAA